jgi:hypothetical protein
MSDKNKTSINGGPVLHVHKWRKGKTGNAKAMGREIPHVLGNIKAVWYIRRRRTFANESFKHVHQVYWYCHKSEFPRATSQSSPSLSFNPTLLSPSVSL